MSIGVRSGEIIGVAGPNGAGKTSLLDVMAGRHMSYGGTVTLDEERVDGLQHARRVRRGLCRAYQHPVVPTNLTVGEVFEAARKAFRPKISGLAIEWAAELVRLDVSPTQLCGALETLDRRKLLLACLVARRPIFLMLDEPASGLVSSEIDEIDRIVKDLAWELGIGVIIVEHRLELLEAIADTVVVLDAGVVIAQGPPEAVFTDPIVREAYFELDAEQGLTT